MHFSIYLEALQDMGTIRWLLRQKKSSPQIKIYAHLKTKFKEIVLVKAVQWGKLFGLVIFIY